MTWEDVIEYEKRDSYEDGRKSGREEGFISACREFGKTNDEITKLLMEKFSLTEEDAINKVANN